MSRLGLCGVSPGERSWGSRQYRRLNRGGDRQANAALHWIVQTRLRVDPRTRDYYERRTKEGHCRPSSHRNDETCLRLLSLRLAPSLGASGVSLLTPRRPRGHY
ncbi:transposase [Streptomyces decoyicus]|uniref:transposase n=1 Tax=Streptomyces decoyicus TaxID=249567 RepID=UPI003636E833